jgi:DNA integrity scanning protein DisA with diadenylate cyclase activity
MAARLRTLAKAILPDRFIHWYRRRRAIRNYLRELGFEIYDRQIRMQLEDLEGRIAARREGFYQELIKDVLDRTELIIQQLDRRIEGQGTRHGQELRALHEEVEALRSSVEAIARQLNVSAAP